MTLVGDRERERTAESLRRHYLSGRLSVEELSERTSVALTARSRRELAHALHDLPRPWQLPETFDAGKAAARALVRGGLLIALATIWSIFSLVLLVAFAFALIVHGPTLTEEVGFPLVWLAGTWLLWHAWRR